MVVGDNFGTQTSLLRIFLGEYECTNITILVSGMKLKCKLPSFGTGTRKVQILYKDVLWTSNITFTFSGTIFV